MFRCFLAPFFIAQELRGSPPPVFHCADPAGFELLGDHGLCTPSSRETRPEGMHPSARGEAQQGWPKGWHEIWGGLGGFEEFVAPKTSRIHGRLILHDLS